MRQALFSIAPEASFLPTLAACVVDGTLIGDWPRQGPFWLSDVTILLPTRRARQALADAFIGLGHSLLPDIRSLGEEEGEAELFLPPFDLPPEPAAVSPMARRLVLAQLIDKWAEIEGRAGGFATPPSAAETFRLADSLGTLIDDMHIERVGAAALRGVAPENLAANWQQTLKFLDIALTAWPQHMAAHDEADIAALRDRRLTREAGAVGRRYGERPVIVAGSTGSQAATAELIAAIARLPRGTVVLPGLDTGLTGAGIQLLLDPEAAPHAHPQYGLIKLLDRLNARPDMVTELGAGDSRARAQLVRRALALPDLTAGWAEDRVAMATDSATALAGVSLLTAPSEDLEARAIAVAARAALAEGRSVGIVSPDRGLARRIAAELCRFDIEVDDAAGTPLFQSAAGRLVRALLTLAVEAFAPVPLMAVLRNPASRFGRTAAEAVHLAELVELGLLRGQMPVRGLAGLRMLLAEAVAGSIERPARRLSEAEGKGIAGLLDTLEAALAPLLAVIGAGHTSAPVLAAALKAALAAARQPAVDEPAAALAGASEFDGWADGLMAAGNGGPGFAARDLDSVLAALMAGATVRSGRPARDDIAIWGRLEARLQSADLMILAGLNEDLWPEPADPGPWLSRGMRLAAGLEPPERRQGQAAHDFEMALGGAQVLLALSARRGTSPTLPSPLLQRLEAFAGEEAAKMLRARGDIWLQQARALDLVTDVEHAPRPAPRPPANRRPRRLSITEIETLMRSPYDIYARHVLRLRPLPPLGEMPGGRERGSAVHAVLGRFVSEGGDPMAPDALARLERLAAEAFEPLAAIGERRDIWLHRFRRTARLFVDFERGRAAGVRQRHAEIEGRWVFPLLDNFALTGRADRIDELVDGKLHIIDFKTGQVPTGKQMKALEAPQMLLEAAIAAAGGFVAEGVAPAPAEALTYIKIGLGPEAFEVKDFAFADGMDVERATEAVTTLLQRHVAAFLLSDTHPMHARILPGPTSYRGDYEHLARTDEWLLGAEGPE